MGLQASFFCNGKKIFWNSGRGGDGRLFVFQILLAAFFWNQERWGKSECEPLGNYHVQVWMWSFCCPYVTLCCQRPHFDTQALHRKGGEGEAEVWEECGGGLLKSNRRYKKKCAGGFTVN